ncbi:MAG: CehA/McbA family metallohydrolase [Oscillospiraceae bacterium]|nr:CehA/McbA family metallohydrolase [Oscillospiraceae bacterium]
MKISLDLHIHSAASFDGRLTPAEIISAARAAGLDGAAVCDHEVMADISGTEIPEGFLLIPGIEISSDLGHILGLFLERQPETGSRKAEDVIDAIHAAGGIAVLAHPFQRSRDIGRLEPIVGKIDGVEVFNGRAARKDRDANRLAAAFAAEYGIACFAGSDAHVAREIGNGYVSLEVPELGAETVRAELLAGGAEAAGTDGRHIDVARSQHTKLKKQGAGPGARFRWMLFACKCAAEDIFRL